MADMIDDILKNIKWLEDRITSEDIVNIGIVLDKISIQAMYFSSQVSDAYALMGEAEDSYKHAVAAFIRGFAGSTAKAEREAEIEYASLKLRWTAAKNMYKKLDMFLDRVDKVIESHRQRVSVIKQTVLKNMTGT